MTYGLSVRSDEVINLNSYEIREKVSNAFIEYFMWKIDLLIANEAKNIKPEYINGEYKAEFKIDL